jgi:hypothetical protein
MKCTTYQAVNSTKIKQAKGSIQAGPFSGKAGIMGVIKRAKSSLNNPFIALKHRNFRYYWIGMCVSLIGTWMQNIAQPWLAYTLTKSPLLLSLVGALQFTPVLLFSLFAGVLIDKLP